MMELSENQLQEIYAWVDQIPLSRPKRSIARDFSDGVLLSEIVKHFFPRMVELHNYSSTNAVQQKMYNWNTMNQRVFKKMGFAISKEEIEAVVNCEKWAIERTLLLVKNRMEFFQEQPEQHVAELPKNLEISPHNPQQIVTSKLIHKEAKDVHPPAVAVSKLVHKHPQQPSAPSKSIPAVTPASTSVVSSPNRGKKTSVSIPPGRENFTKVVEESRVHERIDHDILKKQEKTIAELSETVDVLQLKISKLEQLLKLKDSKIETLQSRINRLTSGQ